jgi:ABC-2 type transport system ATP-binding protein
VIETLVKAGVPVYEATRWKTGLEELFARLTEAEESEHLSSVDTIEEGNR